MISTVWVEPPVKNYAKEGPNSKEPVGLWTRALSVHEGDLYEPFVGTGAGLVAAERLGRRCYAMDIEPEFCKIAIERWKAEASQFKLPLEV